MQTSFTLCALEETKKGKRIFYFSHICTTFRLRIVLCMYLYTIITNVENDNESAEKIGFLNIEQDYARYAKMQNI